MPDPHANAAEAETIDLPGIAKAVVAKDEATILAALREAFEAGQEIGSASAAQYIDELQAKVTCMCGDSADHSPWAGHSPVSMFDYAVEQEVTRRVASVSSDE